MVTSRQRFPPVHTTTAIPHGGGLARFGAACSGPASGGGVGLIQGGLPIGGFVWVHGVSGGFGDGEGGFTFCNHCLGTGIFQYNPNRSSLLRYCNSCSNYNTSSDCHRLLTYQNSLKNSLTLSPILGSAYFQYDKFLALSVLL